MNETMTRQEIIKELTERVSHLEQFVLANDSDSEYFQGVQEAYAIVIGMLGGKVPETTILPAF